MSSFSSGGDLESKAGESPRKSYLFAAIVMALVVLATAVGVVYQNAQLSNARMEVAGLRRELTAIRQDVGASESRLRERFESMNAEFAAAHEKTAQTVDRARLAARKQAEVLINKATVNQEAKHQEITAEIDRIRESADKASARLSDIGSEVGEVKSEVGDVKTQVASHRTDLDRTLSEMKRVNGDLGVMSGLIATNSKEIAALRALGDRDYYEFSLSKAQARRTLAGINLVYKKADPKRNRFTVEVVADDRRVEKKDRTTNEPVQFYVPSKARQPFELVINDVKKDLIVGYLAAPKTQMAGTR